MIIEHFLAILLSITATFSSVSLSSLVNPLPFSGSVNSLTFSDLYHRYHAYS